MHCHPCYVLTSKFYLTGMETSAKIDANSFHRCGDGTGALDSPRGPIEGGQGAVSGRFYQATPEALELALYRVVVAVERVAPLSVTLLCQVLS